MKIYEIGTGYTSIPADKGAATEIVIENLSRALVSLGHDVTVVDIANQNRLPTELPIVEVTMPKGFEATDEALGFRHKLKRVVYSVRLAGVLRRLLNSTCEHVVLHFHNQYNAFFFLKLVPRRLRNRAFMCYTNHSGSWNGEWDEISGVIRRRYFQEAYAQKHADAVLVLNEKTASNLMEHLSVSAERVHLAVNGVDISTYRPLSREEGDAARAKLFSPGAHFVFQSGSVCKNKGQLMSARCLKKRLKEDSNCYFVFAGGIIDAEYLETILDFAKSEGIERQIVYLGEKSPGPELAKLYAAADVCVLPSSYESFGMAALEALSCGTPVLRRSVGRTVAFASEDEGMFSFSDEGEYAALMDRFLDLSEIERELLSKNARNSSVSKYSWEVVARDFVSLLERIR